MNKDLFGNDIPISKIDPRNIRATGNPLVKMIGPGPDKATCGTCEHVTRYKQSKTWYKCDKRKAGGPATDIRVGWPACAWWTEQE